MDRRRVIRLLPCVAAFSLLAMWPAHAEDPTAGNSPFEPAAVVTPSATVSPAATPTVAPVAADTPAGTPKVLYPSTNVSSLLGSSAGGNGGATSLATTFLVLLGLCAAGFYLVRRHPGIAANFKGTVRKLAVSESRSLGNRQFLVVVEYENERMLLGVTPGRIDYLCPLRGPHGEPGAFPPIREGGA